MDECYHLPMTNNKNLTARQVSGRLHALLARSGVDAKVTTLTGRGGPAYSISGDRVAAAELFDELGIETTSTEYTLFVSHAVAELALAR